MAAAKLVAKEQDLNYEMTEPLKQAKIMEEAAKRYLAALAFTRLNSKRHTQLKADVKYDWVRNNMDSLPRIYERLTEMAGGYKTRDRPRRDPRGAGVALINTASRGRGGASPRQMWRRRRTRSPRGTRGSRKEVRKRTAALSTKEEIFPTSTTTGRRPAGTAAATSTESTSVQS